MKGSNLAGKYSNYLSPNQSQFRVLLIKVTTHSGNQVLGGTESWETSEEIACS